MNDKLPRKKRTTGHMYELTYAEQGHQHIFGLDEVGRGPWAGPLVVGAVCFAWHHPTELVTRLEGIKDSKNMTRLQREKAAETIKANALAWGVGCVEAGEMPSIGNMTQVTLKGMRRALYDAGIQPDFLLIDYFKLPDYDDDKQLRLTKGESQSLTIAAASVLAKVTRDAMMIELAAQYPDYGFEHHKGYGTAKHRAALNKNGVIPGVHRMSYKPVRLRASGQLI